MSVPTEAPLWPTCRRRPFCQPRPSRLAGQRVPKRRRSRSLTRFLNWLRVGARIPVCLHRNGWPADGDLWLAWLTRWAIAGPCPSKSTRLETLPAIGSRSAARIDLGCLLSGPKGRGGTFRCACGHRGRIRDVALRPELSLRVERLRRDAGGAPLSLVACPGGLVARAVRVAVDAARGG
jgi:hypothetical protein